MLSRLTTSNSVSLRTGSVLLGSMLLFAATNISASAGEEAIPSSEGQKADAPLQMMVSIKEQQIEVYRGTELVKKAPISSGKRGHSTPTGVFSILEKRRKHFSNLYNNAPMPFMQRLTWSGIALHVGDLPGYPASHGCIRLPRDFAKSLYGMTERGMHVVVTKEPAKPATIRHKILPQPFVSETVVASLSRETIAADPALRGAIEETSIAPNSPVETYKTPHFDQALRIIITPQKAPNRVKVVQRLLNEMGYNAGPVDGVPGRKTRAAIERYQENADLMITGKISESLTRHIRAASGYDEPLNAKLRIRRKFRDIYSAPVTIKNIDREIGTHVFTALDFEQGDAAVAWMAVSAEGERGGSAMNVLNRIRMPEEVSLKLSKLLTPGTSLTITDQSFKRNTGLGTDFVVITR